jgi:hypothetical protein
MAISLLSVTMVSGDAFAFDPTQINMTLNDVQTTSYPEFDVLTIFFSLFNNDVQTVSLSGHNMVYLNDTNANYWEMSTDNYIDGISDTCPNLNSTIPAGQSGNMQLCFVLPKANDIGYSLVLNNDQYMMDWEINEYVIESVPGWFKTTAASWCSDAITESQFTALVQTNIQDNIINVMRGQSGLDVGTQTPDWVKNNACDWYLLVCRQRQNTVKLISNY